MILRVQQGLLDEGVKASLSQLCRWFEVPRRTVYYQPTKAVPKVDEQLAAPIKAMIEENPSFGYRTVAYLHEQEHSAEDLPTQRLAGAQAPLVCGHAFKPCHRWLQHPMSVGLQTCAGFGQAKQAGRHWPW